MIEEEDIKSNVYEIFNAAISSVNPYKTVKIYCGQLFSFYKSKRLRRLYVVGFGKASFDMARAVNDNLGEFITDGIIITKYGHAKGVEYLDKIKVFEAGHPIPDEKGINATKQIIELLKKTDESTLVLCLISGGGSALFVSPLEPITLLEKQKTTKILLEAGADINEVNTIRKHISSVKGGRLAKIAYPAYVKSLILSDVLGDRLDVIASGPTAFDTSTYIDAIKIVEKYGISDKLPKSVISVLNKGIAGEIDDTPKEGDITFKNVENIVIGNNKIALSAAMQKAQELGFHGEILSTEIEGEAKDVGRWLAGIAKRYKEKKEIMTIKKPMCILSGGETTVKVKGTGKGGRNTELALSFAMEIKDTDGVFLLSAGTDGTDGPTDAAGAFVSDKTIEEAKRLQLDPNEYLQNNDSYNFFKKLDCLFIIGPTGTNVMDIQILIIL